MKLLDYAALCLAVSLTVLSFFSAVSRSGDSLEILIQSAGKEWIYPIDSELVQVFHGPAGETTIVVENGSVLVSQSECSEQICVQSGIIKKQGQWIACMPNRVFVTIRGKKEGELDGEVY